jgi:hypothetical protein
MNKQVKEVSKAASAFLTSASVGFVVRNVLAGAVVAAGPVNAIGFAVGSFILSQMIGDKASKYVEGIIFANDKEETIV